jgi:hypothetical protein
VGIGVNLIGRKIGEEIKRFVQLIFEARKDDNRNALLYTPAGDNSVPLNDERIILVKVDGAGKYSALGVLTASQGAKPGEKIFFARGADAAIVSKIKMLNDGSVTVDTDTETEGDATGNYNRKIKGKTDIAEKDSRTYKNEKDVTDTILGNKTETIGGDKSEDIKGKFYFGNAAQNMAKLLKGIIDDIEKLTTFGPPPQHKVTPDSIAALEKRKKDVDALLKEGA